MLTSNPPHIKNPLQPQTTTKNQNQKIDSKKFPTTKQHHQNQVVFYKQTKRDINE